MQSNDDYLSELQSEMRQRLAKLVSDEKSEHDLGVFSHLYEQFLIEPPTIDWDKFKRIDPKYELDYEKLPETDGDYTIKEILKRVAVVKLNGGLGTTMGCKGAKSLITVKNGKTFMDFSIMQIERLNEKYGTEVPLYLMNSFNTDEETVRILKRKGINHKVKTFTQSKCPRIYADTLMPVPEKVEDKTDEGWYPPGHGNIYQSLAYSGVLDELLAQGRDIIFVSNIDNTGANIDTRIANAMCQGMADYIMEVTDKTPADVKGGTLIEINGKIMHLEMPQVPEDHIDDFCSMTTFRIFNTNNIWVNLRVVKERLDSISMEIIANKKKLKNGREVIQLETSIGGSIRNFESALSVRVGRHRFLPVKKTQDLAAIMSDLYVINDDYVLRLNPERPIPTAPIVKLSKHFDSLAEFERRFKSIPSMKDLVHLTVSGDVIFGKNVVLKGVVVIIADEGHSIEITQGSFIENKICTGRLRFTDH